VSGLQLLKVVDQLATVSHDHTFRLWDVSEEPATLQPGGGERWHSRPVVGIVYSQLHQLIATASDDRTAVVINPVLSERLCSLIGHMYPIVSVALTPDAIITADARLHVRVWEMVSLRCVQTFRMSPDGVPVGDMTLTAAVTLRGGPPRLLALADGQFHLFGADDAARSRRDPPSALLFSRRWLRVIGAVGDTLRVWDARTGALVRTLRGLTETPISAVCLDHTEFNCLVGEHNGRVTQFNVASGLLVRPLPLHMAEIIGLALIWSAATGKMRAALAGRPSARQTKEEIVHGALIVSASADRMLHVSSVRRGSLLATFQISSGDLSSLATSANTGMVAAGSSTGTLSLWKLIEATAIRHESRCEGHAAEVTGLAFLADQPLLVSADAQTEVVLWRVAPLKCTPLRRWWHRFADRHISPSVVTALTYEADRHMLMTGDETGSINVWRLSQLKPAPELDAAGAQSRVESRAAASLEAIDVSDIEPVALWVGHEGGVSAMVDISGRAMESGSQSCLGLITASRDTNITAWLIDGGSPESGRDSNLCGSLNAGWTLPLDRAPMLDEEERHWADFVAELRKYRPPADLATKGETRHLLHRIIGNADERACCSPA
jgi:WD40 repeat protein